ncbi:MAG: Crp/Fnr family transcriptional regulator [Pacificimonas sp.]
MRELLSAGRERRFCRGDVVLAVGANPAPLMLLTSGWLMRVRLREDGNAANVGTFLPGDVLGLEHIALPHCADNYVALTPGTLKTTPSKDFADLRAKAPNVLGDMVHAQALDQHFLRQALSAIGSGTAYERLLSFLFQTRERMIMKGMCPRSSDPALVPLTQVDLGMTIGVTSIHVNRVLRTLKEEGLCSLLHQRLIVYDEDGFGAAARRAMGLATPG